MRAFILSILLVLFSSISYANSIESYCDVSEGEIPREQVVACIKANIESNKMSGKIVSSIKDNAALAGLIASKAFKEEVNIDVASNPDDVFSYVFFVMDRVAKVFGWIFIVSAAAVVLSIIYKGAERGQMTTSEKLIWSVVIVVFATVMCNGGAAVVIQVSYFVGSLIGMFIFFSAFPMLYQMFLNDSSSINNELNYQAKEWADNAVNRQIEMNLDDIIQTRKIYIKHAITTEYGKYKVDYDADVVGCIANGSEKEPNLNFYVPPVIAKISSCITDKLSYKKYDIGFVQDRKDDKSISLNLMKMISDNNPAARSIALKIADNPCSMAYNLDVNSENFINACLKTNSDGSIESKDGYAVFVKGNVASRSQILAEEKALKEKYRATAYAEMIKYGLSKQSKKKLKVDFEKMSRILKVGLQQDIEYKKNALAVLKIDFVNEVIVKAGNLQQGFDLVSNLVNFTDTSDELDVKDYFETIIVPDPSLRKGKMLSAMNTLTGNGVANLGLQYEDCYQKGVCAAGAKNPLKTIYQTGEAVQTTLTGLSLGSYATGKYLKMKANTLSKTDPIQDKNGDTLINISKRLLILNLILGVMLIVVFKITILKVIKDLVFAMLGVLSLGVVAILAVWAIFIRYFFISDNYFTLQDLLKKMKIYQMLLSIPIILISFSMTLALAPALQFVMALGLNAIFATELASMQGANSFGDNMLYLFEIIIYISAFITAYVLIYKEFYEVSIKEANEIIESQGRHNEDDDYAYGKVKKSLNGMMK